MRFTRSLALAAAVAMATLVAFTGDTVKAASSAGAGILVEVQTRTVDNFKVPDEDAGYQKVSISFGSAKKPRGVLVNADATLRNAKGKESKLHPDGAFETLCLGFVEKIAEDIKNKDGEVSLKAGTYLTIGAPYRKAAERRASDKITSAIVFEKLYLSHQIVPANAAGQFPNQELYRDAARVPADRYAIVTINGAEVAYVSPLEPPKKDGEEDKKDVDAKNADDKERRVDAWLWNPPEETNQGNARR